jgi:hypothetical protein
MMLKSEKLVTSPARHYFISFTMEEILATYEINGTEMDVSPDDRNSPISACFKA